MEHLWSPWRMKYIEEHGKTEGCIFCEALKEADGTDNLILHRGKLAFVILNLFPYTSGHLMVVPYQHASTVEELDAPTRAEMMELINRAVEVIRAEYHPEGFNIGANIGSVAGAGVEEHVHFHVVPRWKGDTNFMTTIGGSRVLPEELDRTYERISKRWGAVS
jgi:ATP adenylyltransferase